MTDEQIATLRQARFFMELLVEIADVDPDDTTVNINARSKDGETVRNLQRINLADVMRDVDGIIGEPFNREPFESIFEQVR
jgi:hypothetical protein